MVCLFVCLLGFKGTSCLPLNKCKDIPCKYSDKLSDCIAFIDLYVTNQ